MEFAEQMENLIDKGMFDGYVRELLSPHNIENVRANGMELITQVCLKGINEVEETDPNLTIWLDALDHIVTHANPKEAYVGLLEQSVVFAHTDKFVYLLQPIQDAFSKLPSVRASHMEGILKHIQYYIKSYISVPESIKSAEWEGKETLAIEENPQMRTIIQSYKYCLKLITAFVNNFLDLQSSLLASDPKVKEDLKRRESLLRDTLVNLLGTPLIYFDLSWFEDPKADPQHRCLNVKTEGRVVAEKIMTLLRRMNVGLPYFLYWLDANQKTLGQGSAEKSNAEPDNDPVSGDEDHDSTYETKIEMTSIVNYFYLLLDQDVEAEDMCSVFSSSYTFNTVLISVVQCLDYESENMITKKAIALTSKLLHRCNPPNRVSIHGLKASMIQTDSHKNFMEKLGTIIIYSKLQSIRRAALEALRKYLWAFDGYGRYMLLVRGFDVIQHSGLVGYLIIQLKEFIREALYDPQASNEMKEFFLGERLKILLTSVCTLKDGATTDLMDQSDQIISVLNLLRYLLITDGGANRTGFYSLMQTFENTLLSPLRTGLDYSKAHFEQELRQLQENSTSQSVFKKSSIESTVVVDGKEINPEVSVSERIASVQSALSVFDMLNSLLARVNECYSQARLSQVPQ